MKKIIFLFVMAMVFTVIRPNEALAQQIKFEESLDYVNPCTGKSIQVTGYYTVQTNEKNGNKKNSVLVVSGKYKGVGPDGTEYKITGFIHEVSKETAPNQIIARFRNKQHVVGNGSETNFVVTFINTITFDANGNIISESKEDYKTECN